MKHTALLLIAALALPLLSACGEVKIEARDIRKEMALKYLEAKEKAEKEGKPFDHDISIFNDYLPVLVAIKNETRRKSRIYLGDFTLVTNAGEIYGRYDSETWDFNKAAPYVDYRTTEGRFLLPDQKMETVLVFKKSYESEKPFKLLFKTTGIYRVKGIYYKSTVDVR